jgi:glycosyltransferase involved in cell wall biosynthesis
VLVVGPGERSAGGVRSVMTALAGSRLAERYELLEVQTHRDGSAPAKAWTALRGFAAVAAILVCRRADLVYLHSASGASFWRKAIVAAMATAARRPYVLHVHGGGFIDFAAGSPRAGRAVIRAVLRRAAAVVVLTPTWARGVGAIAGRPTDVIPNPVTIPARLADPAARPARILTLARLGPAKGSEVLVRAFAAIRGRHEGAVLVLAGDGDPRAVRALAGALGVAASVHLPGWVDPQARDGLLAGGTVFTLPSRTEGLPMGMLEAMAHGLPVVMTPVGGVPDVVRDGETGRLVPVDDAPALAAALDAVLSDPAGAREMGLAGRALVDDTCRLDRVADRVGDVIERCLRASRANAGRGTTPR